MERGKIVLNILLGPSRWALAKEWARVAFGVPFNPGSMRVLMAPSLTIDAAPMQHVAIDGEVITRTPIQVSVARNALLLMVPAEYKDLDSQETNRAA
jgi:diacylglycerol kinase family enzyme